MMKLKRSQITTEDGTVIIVDPELGEAVSGRNAAAVEAEIERRKAMVLPLHAKNHAHGAVEVPRLPDGTLLLDPNTKVLWRSPPCIHYSRAG